MGQYYTRHAPCAPHYCPSVRSGSYMELRKAYVAVELVRSATLKSGGCYMFSNLRGCDGERVGSNTRHKLVMTSDCLRYISMDAPPSLSMARWWPGLPSTP